MKFKTNFSFFSPKSINHISTIIEMSVNISLLAVSLQSNVNSTQLDYLLKHNTNDIKKFSISKYLLTQPNRP
jgi:hypothetical protein